MRYTFKLSVNVDEGNAQDLRDNVRDFANNLSNDPRVSDVALAFRASGPDEFGHYTSLIGEETPDPEGDLQPTTDEPVKPHAGETDEEAAARVAAEASGDPDAAPESGAARHGTYAGGSAPKPN